MNGPGAQNRELLRRGAQAWGAALDEGQLDRFADFHALLIDWNSRMNLTAITDPKEVTERHFLDSLAPLSDPAARGRLLSPEATLIDVGTGAGFPGIPLAIALPQLRVTLLDSLHKRVLFLEQAVKTCALANVTVLEGRAEDAARLPEHRERYDIAAARAVADLSPLCEYCLPFVRVGGCFLAYKGNDVEEEAERAKEAAGILGGSEPSYYSYTVPGADTGRTLIAVEKLSPVPDKYPRRAGMPTKRPLGAKKA